MEYDNLLLKSNLLQPNLYNMSLCMVRHGEKLLKIFSHTHYIVTYGVADIQ